MKNNLIAFFVLIVSMKGYSFDSCPGTLYKKILYKNDWTIEVWRLGESVDVKSDGYLGAYGICVQSLKKGAYKNQIFKDEMDSVELKIEPKGIAIRTFAWDPIKEIEAPVFETLYDSSLHAIQFNIVFNNRISSAKEYNSFLKELIPYKEKYVFKYKTYDGLDTYLQLFLNFGISNPKYFIGQIDSILNIDDFRSSAAGSENLSKIRQLLETIQSNKKLQGKH